MKKINTISIDQISLMIPIKASALNSDETPDEVQALKHMFHFNQILGKAEEQKHGLNGYTNSLKYGNTSAKVLIMWSWKQPWMGVTVMFYGQGKKLYEALAKMTDIEIDWFSLITDIYVKFKGHVSRIDIAVDLINYGFSVNNIAEKLKNDKYEFINGKTKRVIGLEKMKTIGNSGEVDTIYVNSRKSDAFLRIYNKRKQGISNKNSGYYLQAKDTQDWIRIEAEFKHREAHNIGNELAKLVDTSKISSYLVDCITRHWVLTIKEKDDKEKEGA